MKLDLPLMDVGRFESRRGFVSLAQVIRSAGKEEWRVEVARYNSMGLVRWEVVGRFSGAAAARHQCFNEGRILGATHYRPLAVGVPNSDQVPIPIGYQAAPAPNSAPTPTPPPTPPPKPKTAPLSNLHVWESNIGGWWVVGQVSELMASLIRQHGGQWHSVTANPGWRRGRWHLNPRAMGALRPHLPNISGGPPPGEER